MPARLLLLAVCLPALALFCPACALRPDHLVFGVEHDASDAQSPRGLHTRTSTNKIEAHAVYDLPK